MKTMSLNVQECQRNRIFSMLQVSASRDDHLGGSLGGAAGSRQNDALRSFSEAGGNWKILIYDKSCQEVLAPLVKVGSLRQHGVTLNLQLFSERTSVPDVPAVYFVAPTQENVDKIAEDVAAGLYKSYHLNFSSPITQPLMERLAHGVVRNNASRSISRLVDRYLNFVSLSPFEFSLNLQRAFYDLHGSKSDSQIEALIDSITLGLLSLIVTLGSAAPVIRSSASPSSPSGMIARKLDAKIREILKQRGSPIAQLFAGAAGTVSMNRPVLMLIDREVDLEVMLQHSWIYQPLIHDVFNLRQNKVSVPVRRSPPGGGPPDDSVPPELKAYDLDSSDQLWQQLSPLAMADVAEKVNESLSQYERKMRKIQGGGNSPENGDGGQEVTLGLANAITALPEMTERKRGIDMHVNIASSLLKEIEERQMDKLFSVEQDFSQGTASVAQAVEKVEEIIRDPALGTLVDKERALSCLYLAKPQLPPSDLRKLKDSLREVGGSTASLDYLQQLGSFKVMAADLASSARPTAAAGAASQAALWGSKVIDRSRGLILQGVKQLLTLKADLLVTRICDELMEQRSTSITDDFLYFDPKSSQLGVDAPRLKTAFKQGIVFVVGGGNFAESMALKELAQRTQRQILYGSTDFVSPSEFIEELGTLGGEQHGGLR